MPPKARTSGAARTSAPNRPRRTGTSRLPGIRQRFYGALPRPSHKATRSSFGGLQITLPVVQYDASHLPRTGEVDGGSASRSGGELRRARDGLGFGAAVAEAWTVPLPRDVSEPFEVYVNGV